MQDWCLAEGRKPGIILSSKFAWACLNIVGHAGRVVIGQLAWADVLVMPGGAYYEGALLWVLCWRWVMQRWD
jgi:hypothetical protein